MNFPMDLALELPDNATIAAERRRLQNRLAQRKFRRRHPLQGLTLNALAYYLYSLLHRKKRPKAAGAK